MPYMDSDGESESFQLERIRSFDDKDAVNKYFQTPSEHAREKKNNMTDIEGIGHIKSTNKNAPIVGRNVIIPSEPVHDDDLVDTTISHKRKTPKYRHTSEDRVLLSDNAKAFSPPYFRVRVRRYTCDSRLQCQFQLR
ncbi:hypothetical protein M758_UG284500 [Ceratodon purpureus]|nr:hypothetical protein M758_UG284500 [Ceratodon purpureus]